MNRFHVSLFTYFFGCTISLNCHPVNKCLKNPVALLNQSKQTSAFLMHHDLEALLNL